MVNVQKSIVNILVNTTNIGIINSSSKVNPIKQNEIIIIRKLSNIDFAIFVKLILNFHTPFKTIVNDKTSTFISNIFMFFE